MKPQLSLQEKKTAYKFCTLDGAFIKQKALNVPADEYRVEWWDALEIWNTAAQLDCSLEVTK